MQRGPRAIELIEKNTLDKGITEIDLGGYAMGYHLEYGGYHAAYIGASGYRNTTVPSKLDAPMVCVDNLAFSYLHYKGSLSVCRL